MLVSRASAAAKIPAAFLGIYFCTDPKLFMQIGIFARTFQRPTLSGLLDAIAASGVETVQFNFSCAGLPTLPERVDPAMIGEIRREFETRGLKLAAVSGTFNMIHPDSRAREAGLRRLRGLVGACATLGAPVVTLCTGTRDPDNMWRGHPENASHAAWKDLLDGLTQALEAAEQHQVTLGIEPEPANVVDSARKGRLLLDELRSPRLKIVMDAANLFHHGDSPRMRGVLDEAFDLLGGDIVTAHAKDFTDQDEIGYAAAGKGLLDYDYYLGRLRQAAFDGPLILHELRENEVSGCVEFLRGNLARLETGRAGEAPA